MTMQERFDNFARKHPDATFVLVFGGLGGLALGAGNCVAILLIFGIKHAVQFLGG